MAASGLRNVELDFLIHGIGTFCKLQDRETQVKYDRNISASVWTTRRSSSSSLPSAAAGINAVLQWRKEVRVLLRWVVFHCQFPSYQEDLHISKIYINRSFRTYKGLQSLGQLFQPKNGATKSVISSTYGLFEEIWSHRKNYLRTWICTRVNPPDHDPRGLELNWEVSLCRPCNLWINGLTPRTMNEYFTGICRIRSPLYLSQIDFCRDEIKILILIETSKLFKLLRKCTKKTYCIEKQNYLCSVRTCSLEVKRVNSWVLQRNRRNCLNSYANIQICTYTTWKTISRGYPHVVRHLI